MDHPTRTDAIPASGERIGIVGSRTYPHLSDVQSYVDALAPDVVVVSGRAEGVDITAELAARRRGLAMVSYRPRRFHKRTWQILRISLDADGNREAVWIDGQFSSFGQATYFRNGLIVADSDRLVAFWNGRSRGTRNTIKIARDAGKEVEIFQAAVVNA